MGGKKRKAVTFWILVMKVLIACEESQTSCKAFRQKGHEVYSCDIQRCSGGYPEWHIQGDVREVLYDKWDLVVAHPPCTMLCSRRPNAKYLSFLGRYTFRFKSTFKVIPRDCLGNGNSMEFLGENYVNSISIFD